MSSYHIQKTHAHWCHKALSFYYFYAQHLPCRTGWIVAPEYPEMRDARRTKISYVCTWDAQLDNFKKGWARPLPKINYLFQGPEKIAGQSEDNCEPLHPEVLHRKPDTFTGL